MTEKAKEFTFAFGAVLLGTVSYETLKAHGIQWIIGIVCGLFVIPFTTISCVKCLGKKEWGVAAVCAATAGIWARAVWIDLSHCPWHQLPEEIDKVLNVLMDFFK